ncbi:MAG: tetratricopeptide repeat protein [Phycisphaerae bacterium]|nr:tetratricopeptide repeat protein [Phycisphaerae bacterium]MBN8597847.1 tetratricopeptide repeat protein [Planctomycetota bacterium]
MRNTFLVVLAGVVCASLIGCTGHGVSTRRESSAAKERLAAMKSAMEWQSAKQQLLSGNTAKALESINRSLGLNPNVAKSHVLKGRILMEQGDLEGALNWFGTAEGLDPENVEAQYYSAIVYERLKQPDEALARYRRASDLEPSNPQYVIAAAEVLMDQGKLEDAETELTSHRASFANNPGVNQTLGHIAMMQNKSEDAMNFFEQARLAAPDDPAIQNDLIGSQIACKKFADAEHNITKLMKQKGFEDRRDLRLQRARCLVELDRPMDAREVLVKLTTSDGGASDVEAWIELGKLSYKLKDLNRARTASARLVAIAPERPEGYQLRAMVFRKTGAMDQAHDNAIKAVAIAPTAENYVLLGMIERQMGNTNDANLCFAEALKIEPANPMATSQIEEMRTGGAAVAGVPTGE